MNGPYLIMRYIIMSMISKCCNYKPLYDVDNKNYGICAWCRKPSIFKENKKRELKWKK